MSFYIILIEYIKITCTCIALNELDNIIGLLIGLIEITYSLKKCTWMEATLVHFENDVLG